MEHRRRRSRGSVDWQVRQSQPTIGTPWDVPVHVITARQAVLDGLKAHGFREGFQSPRPVITTMDGLLPKLLDAFSEPGRAARHQAGAVNDQQ